MGPNRALPPRQAMLLVRTVSLAGFSLRLLVALALIAAAWVLVPVRPVQLALTGAIALGWLISLVLLWRAARAQRAIVPHRIESDDAVLSSLGMATDDGELRAACARVARRIHNDGIRVVGF